MTLRQEALRLLGCGFSVIPVKSSVKGGAFIKWAPYQRARPTKELVGEWFTKYQDGLAIVTGAVSGLVVLDMDVKGEHDGRRILESLYGWEPEGPLCITGGGGLHAYYRHPGRPIRNAVSLEPAVDARGDGGFVYAPPSPHPSGNPYRWVTAPWESELPPMPEWLLLALTAEPAPGQDLDSFDLTIKQGVAEGQRNDTAAKIAGHYFALGLKADAVLGIMERWNRVNTPPLTPAELLKVAQSIGKRDALSKGDLSVDVPQDAQGIKEHRADILQVLSERFGIRIDKIELVGGDDPYFRFHAYGKVTQLPMDKLPEQGRFRSTMFVATKRLPHRIGAKAKPGWDHFVALIAAAAVDIDPGPEATAAGELRNWIASYLKQTEKMWSGEDESKGPDDPRQRAGVLYIHLSSFRRHVDAEFGVSVEHKRLCQQLKAAGFPGAKTLGIMLADGTRTTRSLWAVPNRLIHAKKES